MTTKIFDDIKDYGILDTPPESDFDQLCELASLFLKMPISYISFVDDKRSWLKAKKGIQLTEMALKDSFCQYVVKSKQSYTLNSSQHGYEFCLAYPLLDDEDNCLGTLSVLGFEKRPVTDIDHKAMKILSNLVMNLLQSRKLEKELKEQILKRDEFLAVASHELKTPITSIKMHLQLLERSLPENTLEGALSEADRLRHLVSDLLDLSQIEGSQFRLDVNSFDLSMALESLVKNYLGFFADAKCDVLTEIESGIVGVWDQKRLEQVFLNLFSNAAKYAPGRPVTIKLSRSSNGVHFSIQDQGPGVSAEDQKNIFNRFERVHKGAMVSGLGLGLYICKNLIDLHHGTITLSSTPKHGSTFHITLPFTP